MPIFLRALAGFSAILCLWPTVASPQTYSQEDAWETQVGRQRYMEYEQRGEIVPPQSPLYRTLDRVGDPVAAVADRRYFAPFHFIILNEQTPNAFSMPGGDVYVTTGMLSFLRNRDELAGVICHEVNHDIHHDVYSVYQVTQRGRSPQDPYVISYERAAEMNADRGGAYTCAKAGFNPWGMIWNFRLYRETMGAAHSDAGDHPSDAKREAQLLALFQSDRPTFAKFHDDIARATPLATPHIAQSQYSPYGHYQSYSQAPQQYPQYPPQSYPQYPPPQQYPQYPPAQQYPQYPPAQQYPQYPPQSYPQYPPPPPCYPNC